MKERRELAYSRALVLKKGKIHKKTIICICFILLIIAIVVSIWQCETEENIGTSGDNTNILENVNFMGLDAKREIGKDLMEIDYIENLTCSISYPEIGIETVDEKIKNIITVLKDDFILMFRDNNKDTENYFQYIDYETYLAPENMVSLIFIEAQVANESNVISEKAFVYIIDLESGKFFKDEELFRSGYEKRITSELINRFESDEQYVGNMFKDYKDTLSNLEKERIQDSFNQ